MSRRLAILLVLFALFPAGSVTKASAQDRDKSILWVDVKGFIGPGTVDHVRLAMEETSDRKFVAVILAIDTFGGVVSSMFEIIASVQSSSVPVIGFVYPRGRQALSAGTFILMSTDLAVMAPFTKIGSAQPVVGGSPINDTKTINALVKEMEGFAEIHGRNKTQLVRFITHNDNLLASEAVTSGAIDLVASSREELLEKADGLAIRTIRGEETLELRGASFVDFQEAPRVTIVKALSDPIVSSLLVSVGLLVLILGLSSPGFGAEVLGAILFILGLIGQGFNVNYAALAIMGIGAALIVFELNTAGHGAAGIGGVLLLGVGSVFFVTQPPQPLLITPEYYNLFIQTVLGILAIAGGLFAILIYKFAQVRKKRPSIQKYPVGEGRAVDDISPDGEGYVVVQGEYWSATSKERIATGDKIRVIRSVGQKLLVEPWKAKQDEKGEPSAQAQDS